MAEVRSAVDGLPAHQADEARVVGEEAEAGGEHELDLLPALAARPRSRARPARTSRTAAARTPRGRAPPSTGSGAAGSAGGCRRRRRCRSARCRRSRARRSSRSASAEDRLAACDRAASTRARTPRVTAWTCSGLGAGPYRLVGRPVGSPMTSVLSTPPRSPWSSGSPSRCWRTSAPPSTCTGRSSHRALDARHRRSTSVFRFVIWITTGIQPRQWVAVHRKHHAFTDVEGDPHSPELLGWVRVQLTNVALYRREAQQRGHRGPLRQGHPRGPVGPARCSTTPCSASAIGIAILVARLRPGLGLLAAFVHADLYLGGQRGGERHRPPLRPPPVRQHGRQPAVAGVHHGRRGLPQQPPRRAHLGPPRSHRWYQIDLGWLAIRGLCALGLAKLREPALARIQTAPRRVGLARPGRVPDGRAPEVGADRPLPCGAMDIVVGPVRRELQHAPGARAVDPHRPDRACSSRWPRRRPCPVTDRAPPRRARSRCRPDEPGQGILEVVFRRGEDDESRPQRQPLHRRAGQVHLPPGAGRARVRRLRHGRGPLPDRPGPVARRAAHPAARRWADVPFAAALSEHPSPPIAVGEVVGEVLERLGPEPDLAVLFVTAAAHRRAGGHRRAPCRRCSTRRRAHRRHGRRRWSVATAASRTTPGSVAVGRPAGRLGSPPVRLTAEQSDGRLASWPASTRRGRRWRRARSLLVADPFTFPVSELPAPTLAEATRTCTVIGGLASAAAGPGGNRLVIDGGVTAHGAVGRAARRRRQPVDRRVAGLPADRPAVHRHPRRAPRSSTSWPGARPSSASLEIGRVARPPTTAALAAQGLPLRHRHRRAQARLRPGRLPDPRRARRRPGRRRASPSATRCRSGPPCSSRSATRRPRTRTCAALLAGHAGRRRPGVHLQRPGHRTCSATPDHDAAIVQRAARHGRRGGHVLRRRARPGRRPQRPPRLHRVDRPVPLGLRRRSPLRFDRLLLAPLGKRLRRRAPLRFDRAPTRSARQMSGGAVLRRTAPPRRPPPPTPLTQT